MKTRVVEGKIRNRNFSRLHKSPPAAGRDGFPGQRHATDATEIRMAVSGLKVAEKAVFKQNISLKNILSHIPELKNGCHNGAFTLIELLVVLAIVTLLAMTMLPALAKAKYPSMVSNCITNYKQWVQMATVYASDDTQGRMPSFKTTFSAGNPTDVATNFLSNLVPYGMTVAMNFCPVRPGDLDTANNWFYRYGIPSHSYIKSISDLNQWFTDYQRGGRSLNGGYAKLLHDWWVPRQNTGAGALPFPSINPPNYTAPLNAAPWPLKISDPSVPLQPIISDLAEANASSTDPSTIPKTEAHFYNGSLNSINLGFADGHVETHIRHTIQWQYIGQSSYYY
jgi:prepilin-type N-terminal cleavage/methylation domain-containing protein/prepilin-type processing-associated H-X9-DG protein